MLLTVFAVLPVGFYKPENCQIRTELIFIRQLFLSPGFLDLPLFRW